MLGVFIVLMMAALYLSQVAMEASRGREMRELVTLRDEIERSNEELRVEIAELKSLSKLQERARVLGFVQASTSDQLYLVIDGYQPYQEETVAPLQEDIESAPIYDESFGDGFSVSWTRWAVSLRISLTSDNALKQKSPALPVRGQARRPNPLAQNVEENKTHELHKAHVLHHES